MPLPIHAFEIHGGCNCRALRYRVSVPELADRHVSPYHGQAGSTDYQGNDTRLPFLAICHCNDCRRSVGSIMMFALVSPMPNVEVSFAERDDQASAETAAGTIPQGKVRDAEDRWRPAMDIFAPKEGASVRKGTFLSVHSSSDRRYRYFCGRCGTSIAYFADVLDTGRLPEGTPSMLDIMLATVDREDLEKDWMAPERQLWMDCGIPWVIKFSLKGLGEVPRHGIWKCDEKWQGEV